MKNKRLKTIAFHCLLIGFFLAIPVISSPDFDYSLDLFTVRPFLRNFLSYVLVLTFFYAHTYFILPRLYRDKLNGKYIASVLLYFVIIVLLINLSFPLGRPHPDFSGPFQYTDEQNAPLRSFGWIDLLTPLIPFTFVLLISHALRLQQRTRRMELDRYRTELQNLQYQLQPHFLFNSLNNIYSISITDPEKTPEYILELSDILRYLLSTDQKDFVKLTDELNFCRQFVHLQKLRFGSKSKNWQICWPSESESEGLSITPFIIIPIIENVFKYGVHPEYTTPIRIEVNIKNQNLNVQTSNHKFPLNETKNLIESRKIGLNKTRERLELLYPDRYNLEINEDVETYELTLSIELKRL